MIISKHLSTFLTKKSIDKSPPVIMLLLCSLLFGCGGSSNSTPVENPIKNQPSPTVPTPTETRLTLPIVEQNTLVDAISPSTAVRDMAIGINLGNTLDAPIEGEWALAAEEYYVQAFADAGFKHIRIPITWDKHIAKTAPYEIDNHFLDRVEQIVDWALTRQLYVIINVHHDDWIKSDYNNVSYQNRFDSIWLKITERFKDKSSKLIFEIFNEPHGLTLDQINTLNARTLRIIRNQTSNRLVIFAGHDYSGIDNLLAIEIPDSTDQYLIGNFHSYDPWQFGIICTRNWGTEQDKLDLRAVYQKAANWSAQHNIPVMVNEFGVPRYDFKQPHNKCEQSEREEYIRTHVSLAKEFGLAGTFWDDGGSFSTYDRAENTWGPEKDILVEHQIY